MREKVAKGLWECEGECGEGKDAGPCVAGSKVGGTSGALCVREKVEICVLVEREEEPGRQ